MDIPKYSSGCPSSESDCRGKRLVQNKINTDSSRGAILTRKYPNSSFGALSSTQSLTTRQPPNPQMEQISSVLYVRTSLNCTIDSSSKDLDSHLALDSPRLNSGRSTNFHPHSPIPTSVAVTISRPHALTRPNPSSHSNSSVSGYPSYQVQRAPQETFKQPSTSPINITLRAPSSQNESSRLAIPSCNRSITGTSNEEVYDGALSSRSITPLLQGMAQLECLDTNSARSSPILSCSAPSNNGLVPTLHTIHSTSPPHLPNVHIARAHPQPHPHLHPGDVDTSEFPFHAVEGGIRARAEQLFLSDHLSDVCFVLHDGSPDSELHQRAASRWSLVPDSEPIAATSSSTSTTTSSTASPSHALLRRVPAHRLVLALGSPVFHALFFGPLASSQAGGGGALPEIDVRDVEPRAFCVVLKYLYTDEVSLFADPWAAQREESEPRAPSRSSCPHCASPTPTPTSNSSINGAGSEGASSSSASESASAAGAAALANDAHVRRMRRLVDVLYAAHKYLVRALVDAAVGALAHMLCAHTAAPILALSFLFEEAELKEQCFEIIDAQTAEVLANELFVDIDSRTLAAIISRETLTCAELDVYRACVRWVQERRERQRQSGADADADEDAEALGPSSHELALHRRLLGRALHEIRFPALGAQAFADNVPRHECALLTRDEVIRVYEWFNASAKPELPFACEARCGLPTHQCVRFGTTGRNNRQWRYRPGKRDAIQFAVDRRIFLVGVGLYGSSSGPADYPLRIEVRGTVPSETSSGNKAQSSKSAGPPQIRGTMTSSESPIPSPSAHYSSSPSPFTFSPNLAHESPSLIDTDAAVPTASSSAVRTLLQHECTLRTAGDDRIYAVKWGRALRVEPNRFYSVNVLLVGSELSYFGHEGFAEVTVPLSPTSTPTSSVQSASATPSSLLQQQQSATVTRPQAVTFQFHCSAESANGTGIHTGQIPSLLFYSS